MSLFGQVSKEDFLPPRDDVRDAKQLRPETEKAVQAVVRGDFPPKKEGFGFVTEIFLSIGIKIMEMTKEDNPEGTKLMGESLAYFAAPLGIVDFTDTYETMRKKVEDFDRVKEGYQRSVKQFTDRVRGLAAAMETLSIGAIRAEHLRLAYRYESLLFNRELLDEVMRLRSGVLLTELAIAEEEINRMEAELNEEIENNYRLHINSYGRSGYDKSTANSIEQAAKEWHRQIKSKW